MQVSWSDTVYEGVYTVFLGNMRLGLAEFEQTAPQQHYFLGNKNLNKILPGKFERDRQISRLFPKCVNRPPCVMHPAPAEPWKYKSIKASRMARHQNIDFIFRIDRKKSASHGDGYHHL
jgi:hypothetical protein